MLLSQLAASSGASLRDLAGLMGIHNSQISRVAKGDLAPSRAVLVGLCRVANPEHLPALDRDWAEELVVAYLRDCADELRDAPNLDLDLLRVGFSHDDHDHWWQSLSPALAAQLRVLGHGAASEPDFAQLLTDLEPLALRLMAARLDAERVVKFQAAEDRPKE